MLNESVKFEVYILIFHDDIIYLANGEIGRERSMPTYVCIKYISSDKMFVINFKFNV